MTIKRGDVIRLLPEWRDPGDEDITFEAVEDEDGGRVLIEASVDMSIRPRQVIDVSMVMDHQFLRMLNAIRHPRH